MVVVARLPCILETARKVKDLTFTIILSPVREIRHLFHVNICWLFVFNTLSLSLSAHTRAVFVTRATLTSRMTLAALFSTTPLYKDTSECNDSIRMS